MLDLFIGNLSEKTTAQDLRALFEVFGDVHDVRIAKDYQTGKFKFKGHAFVEMLNGEYDAIDALNGKFIDGRKLIVAAARNQDGGVIISEIRASKPKKPWFGSGSW